MLSDLNHKKPNINYYKRNRFILHCSTLRITFNPSVSTVTIRPHQHTGLPHIAIYLDTCSLLIVVDMFVALKVPVLPDLRENQALPMHPELWHTLVNIYCLIAKVLASCFLVDE